MVRNSKQRVNAETEQIRRLMEDDGVPDYQIINQLQIPRSTFYWYKKRIIKQEQKLWDKIHIDSRKHAAMSLLQTLQNCYYINKKIAEDENASNRDRQESTKIMSIAKRHMYVLIKEGPMAVYDQPIPVLPVVDEVKELIDNNHQDDNI